jgi:hypothetical protein
MLVLAKIIIAALVFLTVYIFSFWVVFAQIVPDAMEWTATLAAFLTAAASSFWVWRKVGDAERSTLQTALYWAAVGGAIGFSGGFFGPLIFTPEANQGPLLGIFITGPLGFVASGAAGLVYALCFSSKRAR